jgi:hypothetical protein
VSESIDLDVCGIMIVSGSDTSKGKTNKIPITNNKVCVLQYDIKTRMVKKVDAKTTLENYAFSLKNTIMRDEKVADKIDAPDFPNYRDQVMVPRDQVMVPRDIECREALVLALLLLVSGP